LTPQEFQYHTISKFHTGNKIKARKKFYKLFSSFLEQKPSPGTTDAYGDRAREVTRLAEERRLGQRLVRGHPYLEAEVVYCCRREYCETPEDFISRRTRMAFLDRAACDQALPRIVELMADEKRWGMRRRREELRRAREFLKTFEAPGPGLAVKKP
jgi:glycerol-3-phosphate dehydrogenase